MKPNDPKEKILIQYEAVGNEIVRSMINILARAHQKIDNKAYRKALEELKKD